MYKIVTKDKELLVHGHEPLNEVLNPKQDLLDFKAFIEELKLPERQYHLNYSTKQKTLSDAKNFFNRNFKLHKIPYKGELRCSLDYYILRYVPGIEVPLRLHNITRYINPFDLPIEYSTEEQNDCMVVENITYMDSEEFLKRMKISFQKIVLPPTITELTESSYVHEITHTQLIHVKGIIKDYYNSEVLSIFLELLNIYESVNQQNLLPLEDCARTIELCENLNILISHANGTILSSEEDLIDTTKYSISILKAYGLFIEYINGSSSLKKYILNSIQNIFNGDLFLEELLDEFELTPERITKDEKVLSYFSR